MSKDKENKENRWNPGMGSDAEPQAKSDPDFGPDMGYEEGERQDKSAVADEIRREWIKKEKPERTAKGGPRPG
jgi:hypothetical protein